MKNFILKTTSLFLLVMMLGVQTVYAVPAVEAKTIKKDVNLDIASFEASFEDLSRLETQVLSGEIATGEEAIESGYDVNLFAGYEAVEGSLEIDWPAALWGFLCCPIGFFIYVTNSSRTQDEKLSYWIGVAASTVVSAVGFASGIYSISF